MSFNFLERNKLERFALAIISLQVMHELLLKLLNYDQPYLKRSDQAVKVDKRQTR
jgi:hypothetical protein